MRLTNRMGQKVGFLAAIVAAAIIGGTTTALVSAAIPDSDGTIHVSTSKLASDGSSRCFKVAFAPKIGLTTTSTAV